MANEEKSETRSVETYTDDMVKVLESDQGGTIKKIIDEEEEKERQKKDVSPQSVKNRTYMIVGAALLVLAVGAIGSAAFLGKKVSMAPVQPPLQPAVFTDDNSFNPIDGLSGKQVSALIANKVAGTEVKKGGIEGIFLTTGGKDVNFGNFISAINGHFPQNSTSFVTDFPLGAYAGEASKDPILLLKATSFDDIFDTMRAWEPKMFSDLYGLFNIPLNADTNYLLTEDWTDGIVANKNARILYDKTGSVVMMYVYADDTSVIVTDNAAAAVEVMSRLSGAKVAK